MASTVPGVDRERLAAKLGIGAQAPDLSGLAAPTISLAPATPGLKLGQLRRTGKADRAVDASPISGDTFAATLAKTIAARKAANEQTSRTSRPARVEARQERESAVRDVVRQLKQLVDNVRDAAREAKAPNGTPHTQAGQAIAHRDLEVDAAALRGAFERLTGTDTDATPATTGEDPSLAAAADVEALLQTVADAIAQAMSPEGEIDEAALATALLADPLVLAAAEALIAALQVQIVTAVAFPAAQTDGESAAGEGTGSTNAPALNAPGETRVSAGSTATNAAPTVSVAAEAPSAPAATPGETVATPVAAAESSVAVIVAEAEAIVAAVESTGSGESAPTPTNTVQSAVETAPRTASATIDLAARPSEATAVVEPIQAAPIASAAETEAVTLLSTASAVVIESSPAAAAATGTDSSEVSAPTPTPTSGEQAATILAQAAGGQAGAQADADGQSYGEGGDAAVAVAATVRTSAAVSTSADADGAVPGGQSSASGAPSTGSSPSAGLNSTPNTTNAGTTPAVATGNAGSTAPAARAEAVAQPQGAQDSTPDVELHEQVSPVIVRQARLISGNGGHELTVRLNPDHLGPLHVRISLLEGALSVGLTTANAEAQRALENALPQLRGALVESGLRLDRLDVNQRDAGSGGNGSQSGNQRGSANAGRNGGQFGEPGYAGNEGRQPNAGAGTSGNASFADVLLDQDGRAFGTAASRGARWLGYRAYRRG